jgi:thiamine-phosphate pyrophosphorylase
MRGLTDKPIFALGAITPDKVGACLEAGAYGVAVFSGVMGSSDPVKAAGEYIAAIRDIVDVN